ncbi:MAG: DNA (cytosine-5-)-methyltransferase [Bacilli bacterium]
MERLKNEKKYKVVSLFAGIGGFDLGFDNAGFDMIWANDFDKYAVQTYRANVSDKIVCDDIRNQIDNVPKHDVLVGGFPCQPFSTLGKLKGFDDDRGTMFTYILDIINKNDSKVVVLENVKNIIHHDNGKTFKTILDKLEKQGYYTNYGVVNTADFGIPQRRNRVYIIAFNKKYFDKKNFEYPEPIKLTKTTQDLLDKKVEEKYFISKKMLPTILGKGTKGYIVKPTIDMKLSKTLTATMHKMHRASQDNYITDKINSLNISNEKSDIRKLTPNECRKLQGFPSDWKQVVSDTQAYKQFGNAVTVDVAYNVAKNLMKYIDENKKW